MADNDNKNKVNGQNPDPLVRDILMSAESSQKRLARYAQEEQARERERLRAAEEKHMASKAVNVPKGAGQIEMGLDYDPSSDPYIEKIHDRIYAIDARYEESVKAYRVSAEKTAVGQINTLGRARNVERDITHMAQSYGAYAGVGRDEMFMSGAAREQQLRRLTENVSGGYSRVAEMVSLGMPQDQILSESAKIQRYKEQAAIIERSGRESSLKGFSEEKLIKRADELEQRHTERKSSEKMMSDIRSEKKINLEDYADRYQKSVELMVEANKEYKLALDKEMQAIQSGKAQEEIDNLSTKAKEAAENLNTLSSQSEDAAKKLNAAEREQASRSGKFGGYIQAAQFIGAGISATGRAASEIGYYAQSRQTDARIRTMQNTNAVYFDSKRAVLDNDISAMYDALAADPASRAANEAQSNTYPGVSLLGKVVSNIATGVAGGAGTIGGVGLLVGGPAGAVVGGTIGAVGGGLIGAANSVGDVMDYAKGTTQENTRNEAYDRAMNSYRASTAIQRDKMQTFFSQGMRVYNTTQGLGGAGVEMQDALLNNKATLSELAGVGVSPERAAELAAQFSQAGTFKSGDAIGVMQMAGQVSQRGIMSKEAYTGLAAQLMGGGGQASDMERIMKFAVSEGMDNAKSISELVSATQNMSSELASQGIAGAGAVSESLMASVGLLKERGYDPNLATSAAQSKLMTIDQNMKDTSVNLPNLVETGGIRKALMDKGIFATGTQVSDIAGLGFGQYKTLLAATQKGADQTQAKNLAEQLGLGDVLFDETGNIRGDLVKSLNVNQMRASTIRNIDTTKSGRLSSVAAQEYISRFEAAEGDPAAQKKIIDELYKDSATVNANKTLPMQLAAQMSVKDQEELKGKYGVGAGQEVNQAQMSADMLEMGRQYALELDRNKTAMDNLTTVMKELVTANSGGRAETRAIQAAESGQIGADLKSGASDFKKIMNEIIKRMEGMGIEFEDRE